ncbi:MAG: hypothetical protein IT288_01830 [Bdellovibrionales bacterium]|nr:hypothetical protein [Bdellovibrionales bacterium]
MKWHNMGSGKFQLRLAIAVIKNSAFLCQGYVKQSEFVDRREMAKLRIRIQDIEQGDFELRGSL